jgi:Protein of unknown function (DUF1572)
MDEKLQDYLADAISSFRAYKKLAEKALEQVTEEELFATIDPESNSIAVVMKHMAGNMLSRWTDFLTTDGEKPTRNRDMEFVIEEGTTKEQLLAYWERGWETVFGAVEPLKPEDFERTITIRGELHTLFQAINRQMTHYAYHTGQIVFLAKHFRSTEWKSLSIPRNRSAEFNKYLEEKTQKAEATEQRMEEAANFATQTGSRQKP